MHPHLFTPGPVEVPHSVRAAGRRASRRAQKRSVLRAPGGNHRAAEEAVARFAARDHAAVVGHRRAWRPLPPTCLPPATVSSPSPAARSATASARSSHGGVRPSSPSTSPEDGPRPLRTCGGPSNSTPARRRSSSPITRPRRARSTDLRVCTAELPEDGPLVLVDAVSSLGAVPLLPGGGGASTASPPARRKGCSRLRESESSPSPSADGNARRRARRPPTTSISRCNRRFLEKARPQNPYTPPVTLLNSLAEALRFLDGVGFKQRFADVERTARAFEAACEAMGLSLFVKEQEIRSPAVTAVTVPEGRAGEMKRTLAELGVEGRRGTGEGADAPRGALLPRRLAGAVPRRGEPLRRGARVRTETLTGLPGARVELLEERGVHTMKVLVTDTISEAGVALLRKEPDLKVEVLLDLSREELLEAVADADGMLTRSGTPLDGEGAGRGQKAEGRRARGGGRGQHRHRRRKPTRGRGDQRPHGEHARRHRAHHGDAALARPQGAAGVELRRRRRVEAQPLHGDAALGEAPADRRAGAHRNAGRPPLPRLRHGDHGLRPVRLEGEGRPRGGCSSSTTSREGWRSPT